MWIKLVSLIVCIFASGCGSFINGLATQSGAAAGAAAGKAAPPAASDKLSEMDTPARRQQIATIVRSPTAQDASRVLGNGIGRGLIDEIVAIANDMPTTQPTDAGSQSGSTTRP